MTRGVQFWLDDGLCQTHYKWKRLTGPPTNWNTCFRPPACSVRSPGESQVAWYQQCKGHFFWVMHASENNDNLEVKWLKERLPSGEVKRANW